MKDSTKDLESDPSPLFMDFTFLCVLWWVVFFFGLWFFLFVLVCLGFSGFFFFFLLITIPGLWLSPNFP